MRDRLIAATPLLGAALVNMPVVYQLVLWGRASPLIAMLCGFLAMGLAWGAGFVIEGRKRWFALFVAGLGLLEGVASLAPIEPVLGGGVRVYLAVAGVLSLLALVLVGRTREHTAQ